MTEFQERFEKHPIHEILAAVVNLIETADFNLTESYQIAAFERFKSVVKLTEQTLSALIPEFTTPDLLSSISSSITSLRNQFASIIQDGRWENLIGPTDLLLNALGQLPYCIFEEGGRDIQETLESFRDTASGAIDKLRSKSDEEKQALEELFRRIHESRERLDLYDKQFEEQKGRIDKLITGQSESFTNAQEERSKEYTKFIRDKQTEIDNLKTKTVENLDKIEQDAKKQLSAISEDMQEQLNIAKKFVKMIQDAGVAGHYHKIARREFWFAEILRVAALASLILAIAFVYTIVKDLGQEPIDWMNVLFRMGFALIMLAPLWYCGHESSKHREREKRNKQIELELTAIGPYLEELPDEKAKEIREKLAYKYFGNTDGMEHDDKGTKISAIKLDDISRILIRIAKLMRGK